MQEEEKKEIVKEAEEVSSDVVVPPEKQVAVKKRRIFTTKVLAYTAVLTALSAVCNIFTWNFGVGNSLAISFTYLPDFLAGAILGPIPGFICGLFGDLIGCWIAPKGEINPIILVSSGLLGMIPGIVFWLFRGKHKKVRYPVVAAIVSTIAVYAVCTNLNTLAFYLFYFKGGSKYDNFWAYYVVRTPKQTVIWAINALLCVILYIPLRKLLKFDNI